MAVRRGLLRILSAAASSAVCALPAAAHESDEPHNHLPPVSVTAPEATPPKRAIRPKPSQNRAARNRTVVSPEQTQPAAGAATGVTPADSPDGAGALQPTAA